jgi:hypothetical protein
MTVEQDGRQVSVKVALAGAADTGKLAILRAVAARCSSATVREHFVGSIRVHRVEWTEPQTLPDGRFLHVAAHALSGPVGYNAGEELLLRSVAGIVFVVDMDPLRFKETWESLMRLSDNTKRNGYDLDAIAPASGGGPGDPGQALGRPSRSDPAFRFLQPAAGCGGLGL